MEIVISQLLDNERTHLSIGDHVNVTQTVNVGIGRTKTKSNENSSLYCIIRLRGEARSHLAKTSSWCALCWSQYERRMAKSLFHIGCSFRSIIERRAYFHCFNGEDGCAYRYLSPERCIETEEWLMKESATLDSMKRKIHPWRNDRSVVLIETETNELAKLTSGRRSFSQSKP